MQLKGQCVGCQEMYTKAQGGRHVYNCSAIEKALYPGIPGYLLKIYSAQKPSVYWMFLTIPENGNLFLLDQFLRKTWLECCGHLSMFTIDKCHYSSYPEVNRLMETSLDKIFTPGLEFDYIYDFGTSTELKIKVVEVLERCPSGQVTLLMQNESPVFHCGLCRKHAEMICSMCGETILPLL